MAEDKKRKRGPLFAFLILLVLWAIGGAIQAALWNYLDEDRTSQIMSAWIIGPTLAFCTLVWWTFFSGFKLTTKLAGWGVLFLAGCGFFALFRFDGFDGGFIPTFVYRWQATAEDKFLAAREAEGKYEGDSPVLENPEEPLEIQPGDWPQFRGPNGNSVITEAALRTNWENETPREIWKKRVGPAWSSFAVVDGLVFTQMQIDDDESIVCYDMESAKEIWVHKEKGVRFEEPRMGIGPMATPMFYRGRLYTLGATGILNCLNPKTGKEYWSTNILDEANSKNLEWGLAGSPVAHEGKILVNPGSNDEEETALAAYDWESGEKLWAGGTHQASYSTPVVATLDGQEQVLMFDGLGLTGHNIEDGSQLWHFPWTNTYKINVAQPISRDDEAVLISTSYGTGSTLLRIEKNSGGEWSVNKTDWETNNKFKLKFGDAVLMDGLIYGLSETILTCLDFETGEILWRERGDFGFGQLILVNDVLVILTEKGEVVLIEASSDHPELLRFQAIEGKTWGYPVLAQGRLLVRNAEWMACFDFRPQKPAPAAKTNSSAQEAAPPE